MNDDTRRDEAEQGENAPAERPPAKLHDPFDVFDFEPTDGGEF